MQNCHKNMAHKSNVKINQIFDGIARGYLVLSGVAVKGRVKSVTFNVLS